MRHRLDPLITERASWLFADAPWAPMARRAAERLLAYDDTLRLASELEALPSQAVMAAIGAKLARRVNVNGLHHIPKSGPALIVANHPTGIADAIILHHMLAQVRSDMFIYANSDVLRVLPQLDEVILPVEWRKERRSHAKTRVTMKLTAQALAQQRIGIIFPSGRIAKRRGLRLYERDWMPSAAMIARKFEIPVIPIHIAARNSGLFYALDALHPTLRDITLFYETQNKDRQPFQINIGAPIHPDNLHPNSNVAIEMLLKVTMALGSTPPKTTTGFSALSHLQRLTLPKRT